MNTIKQSLKKKLTKKEIDLVPTSFDVVGTILIFADFPEELVKKEKIIAKAFLKELKHVKTICKKTKKYSGIYRTPKIQIIDGDKTKETTHKENGVLLKLDVEKVYFSARSANERLRIAKLVKPKENVLVMFSGAAPYPCVISKNSDAKSIVAIEANKIANRYAHTNLEINKINNVSLYEGDVKKILPLIDTQKIGLKSRWIKANLKSKIKQKPYLIEYYICAGELESEKKLRQVDKSIKELSKKKIKVMLHTPMPPKYKSCNDISIATNPKDFHLVIECIKKLHKLKERNQNVIGYVFHAAIFYDSKLYKKRWLIENLKTLDKNNFLEHFYLENSHINVCCTKKDILKIIKKTKLKHLCFDIAHYLAANKKFTVKDYNLFKSKIDMYTHIVNYSYKTKEHCCRLRDGSLDFKKYAEFIDFGCIEVYSKSEVIAKEQIDDYHYFLSIKPNITYDRIIMPLPKSAENYLNLALSHSKKGTIIHFYDFLSESEFKLAKEKIKKACKLAKKKFKIIDLVKCGQFAPKTYRICADFKIL